MVAVFILSIPGEESGKVVFTQALCQLSSTGQKLDLRRLRWVRDGVAARYRLDQWRTSVHVQLWTLKHFQGGTLRGQQ